MEFKYYAQIDENGVCFSVKSVAGEINDPNNIEIESLNNDLLYRKFENGRWSIKKVTQPSEPAETLEQKVVRLEQQIQQDNLIQFEVLATIYEEILNKGSV